jgi:hypothetical protein
MSLANLPGIPVLGWLVGLPAGYGSAWLASHWTLPAWPTARARALQAGLVFLAVTVPQVALFVQPTDFPGHAAPAEARRAWAHQTFGEDYDYAEAYLRANPAVRKALGEVQAIAPVEGPNRTATSPGERMGTFTLEVTGAGARALAHLEMMKTGKYEFHGSLDLPKGPLELQP